MNEKERNQAAKIGALWTKLSEKGTWFETADADGVWTMAESQRPSKNSSLDHWRVAEVPVKIIELSCIVGSHILCEFKNADDDSWRRIDFLTDVRTGGEFSSSRGELWDQCRIMQGYWNVPQGGNVNFPEGLMIDVRMRRDNVAQNSCRRIRTDESFTDICHKMVQGYSIASFKIVGTVGGYKYDNS